MNSQDVDDNADASPHGSPESLDRSVAERLAMIRYLFFVAEQQSQLPEAVRSIAILTMHDAVELFLILVMQHVNAPLQRNSQLSFSEYFTRIAEIKPSLRLKRQQQMKELNTARVGFKHNWILPSGEYVDNARIQVGNFLSENTELVFEIALDSVSVVDFIRFPKARGHLRDGDTALSQGDTGAAMIAIVQGFHSAVDEYEKEAIAAHGRSPFSFAGDFTFDKSFYRYRGHGGPLLGSPDQGKFEDKIVKSIDSLAAAVKMLSLGLDYRRYARFRLLTPPLKLLPIPENPGPQLHLGEKDNWPPSKDDCRFCLEFAIDSALQLQDVVFTKPSWRLGMNA